MLYGFSHIMFSLKELLASAFAGLAEFALYESLLNSSNRQIFAILW